MAAFVGPFLLVLLGVGGLVVLFGRRRREIRVELTAAPQTHARVPLTYGVSSASWRTRVARSATAIFRGVILVVRGTGRFLNRLFARPPVALRIPRLMGFPRPRWRSGRRFRHVPSRGSAVPEERSIVGAAAPEEGEAGRSDTVGDRLDIPDRHPGRAVGRWTTAEFEQLVSEAPPTATTAASAVATKEVPEEKLRTSPDGTSAEARGEEVVQGEGAPGGPVLSEAGGAPWQTPSDSTPAERETRMGLGREELAPPSETREEAKPLSSVLEPHVHEESRRRRKVVGRVRPPGSAPTLVAQPRGAMPRARGTAPTALGVSSARVLSAGFEEVAVLLQQGESARAERLLVGRLAEDPRNPLAYQLLGLLYIQRGDFVQAQEVLEEALRRHPNEVVLYGPLGRTYFMLGQYGKALQMYQLAHDADEKNLEYLEQLLLIASRMDRRPLVRVTAEKILALDPKHTEAKRRSRG